MPIGRGAPTVLIDVAETIWILDDDAELGALLLSHPRELELALEQSQPDPLVLDELLPHLPVLMLSALGAPRDRVAGLEAGTNDYLGNPFLFRELQLRVEQLLKPAQISRLGAQAPGCGPRPLPRRRGPAAAALQPGRGGGQSPGPGPGWCFSCG